MGNIRKIICLIAGLAMYGCAGSDYLSKDVFIRKSRPGIVEIYTKKDLCYSKRAEDIMNLVASQTDASAYLYADRDRDGRISLEEAITLYNQIEYKKD